MPSSALNHAQLTPAACRDVRSTSTLPHGDDTRSENPQPQGQELPAAGAPPVCWGLAKRILFRFAFVYLLLYCLPFVLTFPAEFFEWWPTALWKPYVEAWDAVVKWVAENMVHVTLHTQARGGGDMTADHVQRGCFLALAAAVALVWSLLDRRRPSHPRLYAWLRTAVCLYLAAQMLTYGMCKLIPNQFGVPSSPSTLTTLVGEMNRMNLLWAFMAASPAYTIFAGASEVLGGLLLTCRRTRLLGALVVTGAMANVVMLNFGYDVVVKMHSSHLLAMALFVAAPDLRRLVDFFVLGRTPQPSTDRPLFVRKGLRRAAQVLTAVVVLGAVYLSLDSNLERYKIQNAVTPEHPLYGILNVKEFRMDGEVRPLLMTDTDRWFRAGYEPGYPGIYPATFHVTYMNTLRQVYEAKLDTERHTLVLSKLDDPTWQVTFTYSQPNPQTLVFEGVLDGRQVRITFYRMDPRRLPVNRDMRFIPDYPNWIPDNQGS
jgi:hypothetical protein